MRTKGIIVGIALLMAGVTRGLALDGANEAVVTELFTTTEVRSGIRYPAGFDGVRWDDSSLQIFRLGKIGLTHWMAAAPSGDLYFIVQASTEGGTDKPRYQGLVRWDGSSLDHLLQYYYGRSPYTPIQTGVRIRSVTVSPVTAGLLTQGQPVVLLDVFPVGGGAETEFKTEVWTVDDSSSPAAPAFVHELSRVGLSAVVDDSGAIFVSSGTQVQKLTFNGTGYDESTLATGIDSSGVVLGQDGGLYGLGAGATWSQRRKGENDILRIDPHSGDSVVHASVSSKLHGLYGTAWSGDGRYWLCLSADLDVITDVLPDETIGQDVPERVAETATGRFRDLAGGPEGTIFVAEYDSVQAVETTVYQLDPAARTGGGGGGGKGGGGKRK